MKAKSYIAMWTASCLMMTMLFGGAASADSVTVTADRLNMRKEADTSSKVVSVVENDSALSFVSEANGWYQVKDGSKTGYVMSEYVRLSMEEVAADIQANTEIYASEKTGRVTERVNVRALPMTGAEIVRVAGKNDKVTVLGACGDWYQVRYDGKTGYLMGAYLLLEEENDSSEGEVDTETGEITYAAAVAGKTTERVNMRKAANTSAGIVRVLDENASVSVIGEAGTWYIVNAGGKTGYVAKNYVSFATDEPEDEEISSEILYDEDKTGVATERVNMRKSPSTSAKIVRVLDGGDSLTIVGEDGDWYKVEAGGKEGYIMKALVAAGLTMYSSAKEGKTRDEVNLREQATTESRVLGVYKKNTAVTVLGYTEEFYKVSVDGKEGYIASDYVSVSDAAPEQPEVEDEEITGDAVVPDNFVSYPAARSGATTVRVNLRAAADENANVTKVLNKNTTVSVLGEQGNFYQVMYAGAFGYIAKSYVALGAVGDEQPSDNGETMYDTAIAAVTVVTVNMRREPEGDILFTLPAGTAVNKLGELGAWYKVAYGNSTGYIAKDYLSEQITVPEQPEEDKDNAAQTPSGEGKTAYITANSLNMRRGPGTGYGVIKVLTYGDEITAYSLADGWYLIKAGDDTGYVSSKYVSTSKPDTAPSNPSSGDTTNGKVVLSDWWTGEIQSVFKVGVIATVTDVDTGISWQVKRSGGSNHADVQPLTAADTAKMKQAYGGKWSWNRRAIWVTINGVRYAASMNGMPHGTGSIKTNNFDGHHCIHFLNSRTHTGNRLDSAHQAAVQKAYKAGK